MVPVFPLRWVQSIAGHLEKGGVIGDLPWREQLDLPDREWRHSASHLSRPRE